MKIKMIRENDAWVATARDDRGNTSKSEARTEIMAGLGALAGLPVSDNADFSNPIFRAMYANRLDSLEIALSNVVGHRDKLASGEARAYLDIAAEAVSRAMACQSNTVPRMHSLDKEPESRANTHPNSRLAYFAPVIKDRREMDETGNDDEVNQ